MRNVVVAQSGGPTSVINASLLGVVRGCQKHPEAFGRLYAAHHGIEGLLEEQLIDLGAQDARELSLLRTTPAAGAIGTCRYKIHPNQTDDLERIVEVLGAHSIGVFFYIGGNDSMDTAHRVSQLAHARGLDLLCIGVPKTIDNDLGDPERRQIDHTPGYGSAARYWAEMVLGLNEENRGSTPADPVLVAQAMGRRIGFIPAAARLADPERAMPLILVLPESGLTLDELADAVDRRLTQSGRALVIVGEGFSVPETSELDAVRDSFGHVQYGSTAGSVAQSLVAWLNRRGLPVRGAARGQIPGTAQRHAIGSASPVDLEEAYAVGRHASYLALEGKGGRMATIRRTSNTPYAVSYGAAPLAEMANSERHFPEEWIAGNRIDVTDEFVTYARPLIGRGPVSVPFENGLPRFARLRPVFADRRCPAYVPEALRTPKGGG